MKENKWRENLKETTRLMTSQASSIKITYLVLELQYGFMVINFERALVHTHTSKYLERRNSLSFLFITKEAEEGELVMSEFSEL